MRFRSGVAKVCLQIGGFHQMRAERAPGGQAGPHWREARSWYGRSLDVWRGLERAGAPIASHAADRDKAAAHLAASEAALARLEHKPR